MLHFVYIQWEVLLSSEKKGRKIITLQKADKGMPP